MGARRVFLALLWLLAALDALILGIRIAALFHTARWAPFYADGFSIYAIWRLRHGLPLYRLDTRLYFQSTPYNFLYYWTYAKIVGLFGAADESIPWLARLPTLPVMAHRGAGHVAAPRTALPPRVGATQTG